MTAWPGPSPNRSALLAAPWPARPLPGTRLPGRQSVELSPGGRRSCFLLPPSCLQSVSVPALGFAWIDGAAEPPPAAVERKGWFGRRTSQALPPLAEENVLRNEFVEVHFDPHTGAIRAISDYHSRNPRLAQQIALRLPGGGKPAGDQHYSVMAADELTVTSAGPLLGENPEPRPDHGSRRPPRGRLSANHAARRGSRIIEIEMELDIDRLPEGGPWDSYYAARFAWKDEAAKIERCTNMAKHATELTQFESPHFINISPRQAADDPALRRTAVSSPAWIAKARHVAGNAW